MLGKIMKIMLAVIALALALLWLAALFCFPAAWHDGYGMNQLLAHLAVSALLLLHGLALSVGAALGVVRWRLTGAVLVAPVAHLAGAPLELPLCLVFFTLPAAAIIMLAIAEMRQAVKDIIHKDHR